MALLDELIGESAGVEALRKQITRLLARQSKASRFPPVLIQGETGTGKGLVARALRRASPRADGPFIAVNCAAIPETLLEVEMFGFERGAFTDARQAKTGLFQAAHRGTIFLDEVALLPPGLQGKLLTVIEDREVRRLGSTRSEPVDVWIVAATSQDLETETRAGRFREELYHRLAVVTLRLIPLRERGRDILLLAEHFLGRACAEYGLPPKRLDADARAALLGHRWPGNVRELANLMERAVLLVDDAVLGRDALALHGGAGEPARRDEVLSSEEAMASAERQRLHAALQEADGNLTRAAERLQVPRNTLRYRLERQGLRAPPPSRQRGAPAPALPPADPPRPVPVSRDAVQWEPRRLALLRAGLAVPPSRAYEAEARSVLELAAEKTRVFGGHVAELGVDEVTAVFGLEPMEDAVQRAALAAVAIQKAVARAERASSEPPAVKIVIHVEELMLGRTSGATELHAESRLRTWAHLHELAAMGEAGAILATQTTVPFLERRFELAPAAGPGHRQGAVYRLTWQSPARPAAPRPRGGFVGRRDELVFLRSRLATMAAEQGHVVGIVGEAGIGKSRLLVELREGLPDPSPRYLEGRCLSYGSAIPYVPIIDILRAACGIVEADPPETMGAKVRSALEDAGMSADAASPYLLHLMGVREGTEPLAASSPDAIQARTLESLRQLILKASHRRPIVLAIEDIHWVDRASDEFIDSLVESLPGTRVLLIGTYRPGYRPRWMDRSYATQVALPPLSPAESLSIVQAVMEADRLPGDLAALILARAEGNPFFLEELSRSLRDRGDLGAGPGVPDTVQAVLMARLDRLPDGPRTVLQAASVLGREAPLRVLAAVLGAPPGLDTQLRELTRQEFLYEPGGATERVFVFKHALTQEVVYASLRPDRRQDLHEAAARTLEALHAERPADVYDRLAYHYAKTAQADKAVEYLTRFGRKAARLYAHAEAVAAFDEALRRVEQLPPADQDVRRADIVPRFARALTFLGRFQDAVDLLRGQEARVQEIDNPWASGAFYLLLAHTYTFQGDRDRVAATAERALDEARRCGDEATMGKASYVLAMEGYWSGRAAAGIAYGRQAVALLDRTKERWWLGQSHFSIAANHVLIGEFDPALEAATQASAIGEALADPRVQTPAGWLTGVIHAMRGQPDRGIEICERALALSPDPLNTADALGWTGYVYIEKGEAATAIRLLERSVQQWSQFRIRPAQGAFLILLGEAYLLDGQLERARRLAGEGLSLTRETRYMLAVGWGQRLLGRIDQASGRLAEADGCLHQAGETFAAIDARFELARTHLDRARLAHRRSQDEAARVHLAEARALFTVLRLQTHLERTDELAQRLGG
jgi:transcriptional regulator with AAA-type ATPase domain/predicted ATPase